MSDYEEMLRRANFDKALAAQWTAERAADYMAYEIANRVDRGTGTHTRDNVVKARYTGIGGDLCGKCFAGLQYRILRNFLPGFTMSGWCATGPLWRVRVGRRTYGNYQTDTQGPYWVEWYDRSDWPLGVVDVLHRRIVHPYVREAAESEPRW